MFKFLSKIFDVNEKQLKKLQPMVEEINEWEPKIKKWPDKKLKKRTEEFKNQISEKKDNDVQEILDNILPESFAITREAIRRTVAERAFDVQLMAAIALHQGKIAEQKTGEGKTLSAAIALYLNGLTGGGCHLITVNDYLARRDTGWYGRALNFLGLSVGCIIHEQAFILDPKHIDKSHEDERLRHLRPIERKQAYEADITYGTNNEFGFDYLRDNMVSELSQMSQRGHYFAVIDEVDSILIDEARTPLIISAPDTEPTKKYYDFAKLIKKLNPATDYTLDEKTKTANLTEHGIIKVEKILGMDNLYEKDFETIHHIENALRARTLYQKDRDYVVRENEVVIVDEFTGRLMFGRRYSEGMHQAIEAKEGVQIQQESKTLATISFQNYFRMYEKLAGMTGTAATEAEELHKIYKLDVMAIPTNKPMVRKDRPDVVYKTIRAKYTALAAEIEKCYQKNQPVLVGTTSIAKNELVSRLLRHKKIPHQILNAKNHEKEAEIIAQAGRLKAITVATNMAGRGVDIVLGGDPTGRDKNDWQKEHQKVIKLGGLHVIGTERHEARRIDNQLRGRSGRQGDPGSSRFYLSLEDDIMRIFGGDQVKKLMDMLKMPENIPLEHRMVSKAIEQSQGKVEGFHFDSRKHLVEYDDVMNKQREIIYKMRRRALEKSKIKDEKILLKEETLEKIHNEIKRLINMYWPKDYKTEPEIEKMVIGFSEIIPFDSQSQKNLKTQIVKFKSPDKIIKFFYELAIKTYEQREKQLGREIISEMEKFVYLTTIDKLWVEHLDAVDDLREGIGLRGYGQRDPLIEYKNEAYLMFEGLIERIDYEIERKIFRIQVNQQASALTQPQVIYGRGEEITNVSDKQQIQTQPLIEKTAIISPRRNPQTGKKLGRNDPCPCGSGKKFKKCCYLR